MLAEIVCFFAGSDILSRFLFGMIYTWDWEDMSLFEYKRSDSVLFNVILITGGTILFTPQNAQLLTRCHLIGISKVALGGGNVPKLSSHTYKLQLKIKKNAANTCSNDVVVTQNNTHHISNSQKTAKSHDRES